MSIATRLKELGLTLPTPQAPVGSYVPYRLVPSGEHAAAPGLLYTSGMIPLAEGKSIFTGKLGAEVSLEQGQQCAQQCLLNGLAWAYEALEGELDRIKEVLQVRGFVACTPDFYDHPRLLNGASDLLVEIFGERGRHTRAAVGCPSLPLNVPVEIDFLFEVE